jgi:hypothetical protein
MEIGRWRGVGFTPPATFYSALWIFHSCIPKIKINIYLELMPLQNIFGN